MILVGPQGCGKGTQSEHICEKLEIPHVSTGDIFRENIKNDTELGKEAKAIMDRGDLVPDEVTINMVKDRLAQEDAQKGYLLDGFPRNTAQAEALDTFAPPEAVVEMTAHDDLVLDRILGRLVCKDCGAVFNTKTNPPSQEGVCDHCNGTNLQHRSDDTPEAIKHRLQEYHEQTAPIIDYYKAKGIVKTVNAEAPIEEVFANIMKEIGVE